MGETSMFIPENQLHTNRFGWQLAQNEKHYRRGNEFRQQKQDYIENQFVNQWAVCNGAIDQQPEAAKKGKGANGSNPSNF